MRLPTALILALLIGSVLPSALGRQIASDTTKPASSPAAAPLESHLLPTTNLQQPSPLLNAPRAGNWTEVRGTPRLPRDAGDDLQPRIINGEADPDLIAFPYIAYMDRVLGDEVFSCTGSLVGPSHVLTAAHCVVSEADGSVASPGDVTVWVDGTWHDVAAVYAHSSYARMAPSSGPSYDIAMLALATPSVAATVALTSGSTPLIDGETVWAAGFGITETGESSDILRYTDLEVFAEGECPLAFSDDFCAGGTSGYTCQGDSGGPIVRATSEGDELVGLTSFGDADCYTPYSYYVRVADHLSTVNGWMLQTVPSGASDTGSDGGSLVDETIEAVGGMAQDFACWLFAC